MLLPCSDDASFITAADLPLYGGCSGLGSEGSGALRDVRHDEASGNSDGLGSPSGFPGLLPSSSRFSSSERLMSS